MGRFFNTAGPVNPEDHYSLPPLARIRIDEVGTLIAEKKYFVPHAPRQTGKTTCLLALRETLNREGRYLAVYANVEVAQGARERVAEAMGLIIRQLVERARDLEDRYAVAALYAQHTGETGQRFEPGAVELVWDLTRGQPWLVNALGYEACFRSAEGRDRTRTITRELLQAAKESLIEGRVTHLDQLADLLVIWPHPGGVQKVVVELKVLRGDRERAVEQGIEQTAGYMDRCGAPEGHLAIFDRDPARPWAEKIYRRDEERSGRRIAVWGL